MEEERMAHGVPLPMVSRNQDYSGGDQKGDCVPHRGA
jgi:hypothetical protein